MMSAMERLVSGSGVDVLIGEPVGSCIDLATTVVQPLKRFYGHRFEVAPFSVLIDARQVGVLARLRMAAQADEPARFPDSVLYIYEKQLEEADLIVLNKSDMISAGDLAELKASLTERFPNIPLLTMSALTGDGVGTWFDFISQGQASGKKLAGVDYDTYAAGEAALGWMNASAQLQARGDIDSIKPHEMLIGRCQRSDDVVEPRLKTQWFVRVAPLAAAALEATRAGKTQILPERFVKVWEHWMTEMRDWNVSRQLWWGHRIPAWYCPDGHTTVTADQAGPAACEVCGRPAADLRQDDDIFDTWFSSGLWPFSTLGWPEKTRDFERFYPGSVMETAYDIIFFWVARMMMLGIHLTGEAPFHTVYLSGLIRDPYGQKMSKTKGNSVDPLETIDEVGADALRFALINGTAPGNDARLGAEKLENSRNFANKLWNVARFVLGARPASIAAGAPRELADRAQIGPGDRWILSRAAATVGAVDRAMAGYTFGDASQILYEAIWNEYCDWGVELAKIRLADESLTPAEREATWWTLVGVLDTYLRLLHPIMPFITEAIWERLPHSAADPALLIVADWPASAAEAADSAAEAEVAALIELVRAVRNARAEARVEPAAWLPVDVFVPESLAGTFEALRPAIERLARAKPLGRELDIEKIRMGAEGGLSVIAGEVEAVVRPAAKDDAQEDRDRARLERELADAEGQLAAARTRLANDSFTSKAPPAVVDGVRARASELQELVSRLAQRLS